SECEHPNEWTVDWNGRFEYTHEHAPACGMATKSLFAMPLQRRRSLLVVWGALAVQLPAGATHPLGPVPAERSAVIAVPPPGDSPSGQGYPDRVWAGTRLGSRDRRYGSAPRPVARRL